MTLRNIILLAALLLPACYLHAQEHRFDPPWNRPPEAGVNFTIHGIDNVPDLYGDIHNPQLVIFFAGNQFMVIDSLLTDFKKAHPEYQRVFAETLPPGILARQIETGSLTIGNMRIDMLPDIYTAGKSRIDEMKDRFSMVRAYAGNRLAIMVRKGNPQQVQGLKDLGRSQLRVSMPNPAWEGIGRRIEEAYRKAGGNTLHRQVMQDKVKSGLTYLTKIHHRETPMRLLYGQAAAAPVWYTEAYYQQLLGHPLSTVEVPEKENIRATYMAGVLKNAPHPEAAKAFMEFLTGPQGQAIYQHFGFTAP